MKRHSAAVLPLFVLWAAFTAHAVVKSSTMRITVLDEETHALTVNDTGVPKNCDFANFDAYCHNSWTTVVTHTLVVQEGGKEPYRVTCTEETRWSRCKSLLKGYSFDARKEKGGLLIYYLDEAGKLRKQLYTYVADQRSAGAKAELNRSLGPSVVGASQAASSEKGTTEEAAKCSFISTPIGADILVDGKFVGSTPSALNLSTGKHAVTISMRGFAEWTRELTVATGSDVTVNAVLERTQ